MALAAYFAIFSLNLGGTWLAVTGTIDAAMPILHLTPGPATLVLTGVLPDPWRYGAWSTMGATIMVAGFALAAAMRTWRPYDARPFRSSAIPILVLILGYSALLMARPYLLLQTP